MNRTLRHTVATLNLPRKPQLLGAVDQVDQLLRLIRREAIDILAVQELHEITRQILLGKAGVRVISAASNNTRRATIRNAILVRDGVPAEKQPDLVLPWRGTEKGQLNLPRVLVDGVLVTGVHLPTRRRLPDASTKRAAMHQALTAGDGPGLLLGDFNQHRLPAIYSRRGWTPYGPGIDLAVARDVEVSDVQTIRTGVHGRLTDHPGIVLATITHTPPPSTPEAPVSTGIYLEDHPPARRQFRDRMEKPDGLLVIHTAESILDTIGPDTGAEAVARFIAGRSDPGSYHRLVDSDSIVPLVRFSKAAYGDGTGSNEYAIHISFALATTDWTRLSPEKRDAFLHQGAIAAAEAIRWLKREHGITVPLERVTRAQSEARRPGFISHAERDPARRSDPGANFPWSRFLRFVAEQLNPTTQEDDMPYTEQQLAKIIREAVAAELAEQFRDFDQDAKIDVGKRAKWSIGTAFKSVYNRLGRIEAALKEAGK